MQADSLLTELTGKPAQIYRMDLAGRCVGKKNFQAMTVMRWRRGPTRLEAGR